MTNIEDKIKHITARQIFDSRGWPTLEVKVITSQGFIGIAGVPSGTSTGKKEVMELRDGGKAFGGRGVGHAIEIVNTTLARGLAGMTVFDQQAIDKKLVELDGTPNKSHLGGNTLIGASIACAKAAAASSKLPVFKYLRNISGINLGKPKLMFNLINGGLHADNGLDIQEYVFIPQQETLKGNIEQGIETYHKLANILRSKNLSSGVGDEGGFSPNLKSNTEAFELLIETAESLNLEHGKDYFLGFDAAANSFVQKDSDFKYNLKLENKSLTSLELIALYETWVEKYKLETIEDGLAEDDVEGWKEMTQRISYKTHTLGQKVEVVGDDFFVTHAKKLIEGARLKIATAIIIKPNQVGTLSETIETIKTAKKLGYSLVASHRSGETNDDFIADLAVGCGCDYLKAGAPARGERMAKYNRLLEIESCGGSFQ